MAFWRTYFHFIWTTKNRHPEIGELEQEVIATSFTTTFVELGVKPHAVGYMPDHVHMAVSIPPKFAPADLARRLKGASSHAINEDRRRIRKPAFAWQDSYGVLTFSERGLPDIVAYVTNQREIHAARKTWRILERTTEDQQPD